MYCILKNEMSDFRVLTQNFIQRDITLYMQKKISVSLKIDTDGLCVRSRKKNPEN